MRYILFWWCMVLLDVLCLICTWRNERWWD